ncbi:flagellar biosynthesis protein FlaG [Saccharibacillus sp. O16]|nr:flagellar biosynthesis protein FlaG [Saccharibacillus sp. O16]
MSSSISSGLGGNLPIQKPNFQKHESTIEAAPVEAAAQTVPITTIPQIHQTQEQSLMELQKAIQAIQGPQKSLEISVHEKTHAIMVKVLNKETGDVIREIPSEKILDVVAKMMEFTGILVDKKV